MWVREWWWRCLARVYADVCRPVNLSVKLESFVTPDAHVVVGDEDGPMLLSRLVMVRNSEQVHSGSRWRLTCAHAAFARATPS